MSQATDWLETMSEISRTLSNKTEGGFAIASRIVSAATSVAASLLRAGLTADEIVDKMVRITPHRAGDVDVKVDDWLDRLPGRKEP